MATLIIRTAGLMPAAIVAALVGCSSGAGTGSSTDSTSTSTDLSVAIAYVKRPVASLGNPTVAVNFQAGGDLYMRTRSSPSAPEINITGSYTQGQGDVSDPEVSYDGTRILFSMRGPNDPNWRVWEYDIPRQSMRQIVCDAGARNVAPAPGDDIDPAYLPDGRIVFSSNRQEKSRLLMQQQRLTPFAYLDEYEREPAAVLHVMESNGNNCRQISFNQSHDRNPTVLQDGRIMYARWDHIGGRNEFNIFTSNPDGTKLFVLYGAHSHDTGNSFLHPREMPDERLISSLMPLSGTREGGGLVAINTKSYSERCQPIPGLPADCNGQAQATAQQINLGEGVSQFGRFSTPYPLWDGTSRVLASWTPSQPTTATNALTGQPQTVEGTPVYGVYMIDLSTGMMSPVVTAPPGYAVLDPVAIQARPSLPNVIADAAPADPTRAAQGTAVLNVKSVYDTDSLGRMGAPVLVAGLGECIPKIGVADRCAPATGIADLVRLKDPLQTPADLRPARFVRITKAVPTPAGLSRAAIGETEFEMQQILGYAEVEPDGSFKVEVPADTPIAIAVLDKYGRAFTPHTSWIQVRPGETPTCNGCHSPRRDNAINAPPIAGNHPNTALYGNATNVAGSGETMAEMRARIDAARNCMVTSNGAPPDCSFMLKPDMGFRDVWTAGRAADPNITLDYSGIPPTRRPVNGVIDYPTHIAPLWTASRVIDGEELRCTRCHNNNDRSDTISRGLDLNSTETGTGRARSYDELMVGDPIIDPDTGLPQVDIVDDEVVIRRETAQVIAGESRASHLMEVLFHQELRADGGLPATQNHGGMLNDSEKRLVAEWIDLGAQYYNSPRDGSNVRGAIGLLTRESRATFDSTIQPILLNRCGACHRAVGTNGSTNTAFQGNRFVLTGQAEGDFNVTLSMINVVSPPGSSELLRRASSFGRPASGSTPADPVHPQVGTPPGPVLPAGSTDYNAICVWISGSNC